MKMAESIISCITRRKAEISVSPLITGAMKYFLLMGLLSAAVTSKANQANDTIPFWTISYGKTVILTGNINSASPGVHELVVKPGEIKDVTVSFSYDSGQPGASLLTVREGKEELRTIEQDPVIGAYFRVPVRELIGTHQSNVRYQLDFYYTDDRGQKDRKLGTITFIFK